MLTWIGNKQILQGTNLENTINGDTNMLATSKTELFSTRPIAAIQLQKIFAIDNTFHRAPLLWKLLIKTRKKIK